MTPVAGVASGIVGFVSTLPHLIHSLFLLPFRRAWSMRLDLQCNGIKHIVSHLRERRTEPIKPPTCPAGKVDQKLRIYRKWELFFSWLLVKFTPSKKRTSFGFLCAVAIDLLRCLMLYFGGRVGVTKRGHHQEIKGSDVTGVAFFSPRSLPWICIEIDRTKFKLLGLGHCCGSCDEDYSAFLAFMPSRCETPSGGIKLICFSFRSAECPFFFFNSNPLFPFTDFE